MLPNLGCSNSEGALAPYRDRSDTEIRDIHLVTRQQNNWSDPRPVLPDNWEIDGCCVNGPSVAADGRNVVVAWYTGANDSPRVKAAFSNDAGATFGKAVEVAASLRTCVQRLQMSAFTSEAMEYGDPFYVPPDRTTPVAEFVHIAFRDEGEMRVMYLYQDEGKMRWLCACTKPDVACFDD